MIFVAEDYDDENIEDSFTFWESSLLKDDIAHHGSAKSVDMSHRINTGYHFFPKHFPLPRFTLIYNNYHARNEQKRTERCHSQ